NLKNQSKTYEKESPYRYLELKGTYDEICGYSDFYMNTFASLSKDIIPSLDALPDGKYIQFYENYFQLDAKGEIIIDTAKIAGTFSLKNNNLDGKALWLDLFGDTLKAGTFVNGLKQGNWILKNASTRC